MAQVQSFGKILILLGGIFALTGVALMFSDKIPFIGKLPGDISIKKENFQLYFPVTTSILISLLISAVMWLISWIGKK